MHRIAITVAAGAAAAALLAACSSSAGGGTPTHSAPAAPPTTAQVQTSSAPAVPETSSSSAPTTGTLSGTWNGQYGGAYSGTFTLNWQQSGSKLSGSIHISNPNDTENIDGTVNGSTISFGTVGSLAVTYSGTVSGGAMSGTYKVGGATGGQWSASQK